MELTVLNCSILPSAADKLVFEKPGVKRVSPGLRGALSTEEVEARLRSKFPSLHFPFVKQDHLHGVGSDAHLLCEKHGLISRVTLAGLLYGGTTYGCTQCAVEAGAVHRAAHPKHYTQNSMSRRGLQSGIFIAVKKEFPDAVWEATLPDGKELDIYIPSLLLGIELNGQYWHSTAIKSNSNYHIEKSISAAKCDIAVIHVWEEMAVAPFTNILNILRLAAGRSTFQARAQDRLVMLDAEQAELFHMTYNCKLPSGCRFADYHLAYMQRGKPKAVVSFNSKVNVISAATTTSELISLNFMAKKCADLLEIPGIRVVADCLTPVEYSWAMATMVPIKAKEPIGWNLDKNYKLCELQGTPPSGVILYDCGYRVFETK